MTIPLCSAPFSSIMIDTNKGVKPCCNWSGKFWGNLKDNTITEIKNTEFVKKVQQDMIDGVWNEGCIRCKEREEQVGSSVRQHVYNKVSANYEEKILYLEYNSTNTCNLACVPCSPSWSSHWLEFKKRHGWTEWKNNNNSFPPQTILPIEMKVAKNFIDQVDLSEIQTVWLKGGEPFLNKENILLFEHLDKIGVLPNVKVWLTTNGTVYNDDLLDLLAKAKNVSITVSIDGPGELNRYIRWSDTNHEISNSENLIKTSQYILNRLPNLIDYNNTCSVQVLNIFKLKETWDWWHTNIYTINPAIVFAGSTFEHVVLNPESLSVRTLSDNTRAKLADYYESLNYSKNLISFLRLPYLGNAVHNQMVGYINSFDRTRDKKILEIVPELAEELVYL
jgi:MoaA/NifB/PqqE/SkfB family radical SAM enzyme